MKLFEYAVWKDEKRDKDDEVVEKAVMLVEPTTILAESEQHVGMIAARGVDEEHMKDVERINVVIRPF
jgi:hypothetical protein